MRLNQPKKPRFSWWSSRTGLSRVAQSAGVSVSAKKPEKPMDDAMTRANWRKMLPVAPLKKDIGTKTTMFTRVMPTMALEICPMLLRVAW